MKVVFVGNCQAQALAQITHFLEIDIEIEFVPFVFDIPNFDTQEVKDKIYNSDFVFSQRVSEDYAVEFIRPSVLKETMGSKVTIWPNIYFDGYFPGVRYVYAPDGTKITGPLTDYHFVQIQDSWARGIPAEQAWEHLVSPLACTGLPDDPVADSLFHLRHREQYADVHISDYIEDNFAREKIFYSMNHPTDKVILEMLARLFRSAGISTSIPAFRDELFDKYAYTLNEINLPILPCISNRYDTPRSSLDEIKGREIVLDGGRYVTSSEARTYTGIELVEAFYRVYDTAEGMTAVFLQGFD